MCAVMVYELLGPILTKWALGRAGEIDDKLLHPKKYKPAVVVTGDDGVAVIQSQQTLPTENPSNAVNEQPDNQSTTESDGKQDEQTK